MIAIEKDRRAADVLAGLTNVAGDRLRLIEADAMQSAIWEMGTTPAASSPIYPIISPRHY